MKGINRKKEIHLNAKGKVKLLKILYKLQSVIIVKFNALETLAASKIKLIDNSIGKKKDIVEFLEISPQMASHPLIIEIEKLKDITKNGNEEYLLKCTNLTSIKDIVANEYITNSVVPIGQGRWDGIKNQYIVKHYMKNTSDFKKINDYFLSSLKNEKYKKFKNIEKIETGNHFGRIEKYEEKKEMEFYPKNSPEQNLINYLDNNKQSVLPVDIISSICIFRNPVRTKQQALIGLDGGLSYFNHCLKDVGLSYAKREEYLTYISLITKARINLNNRRDMIWQTYDSTHTIQVVNAIKHLENHPEYHLDYGANENHVNRVSKIFADNKNILQPVVKSRDYVNIESIPETQGGLIPGTRLKLYDIPSSELRKGQEYPTNLLLEVLSSSTF